jgi:uncharacterized damage-inducible protein DinB
MTTPQQILSEFDGEMASTRRLLERLPADRLDWKPHAKSRSLGELATHVAETARWGMRLEAPTFTIGSQKAPTLRTPAEYLARFDENVEGSRAAIARQTDESLREEFTVIRPTGEVFFALTRGSAIRRLLLNHLIHHRGQLTVYLRLNDIPVPGLYGPSADEGNF